MDSVDRDKKKVRVYYSLLVSVICIIAVSYAFFTLYLRQSDNNTLASRTCFSTSFTEDSDKISLTNEYPVIDSTGMKKQAFSFTIKNNCSSYVKVYITIDSAHRGNYGTSYLDDNYIKVNVSPKDTTNNKSVILGKQSLTDLDNNSKGYVLVTTFLGANEEKSYDLRLWMDESVTLEQGLGKSWEGKIVVVSEASNGPPFAETILANNEVKEPLTTPGTEISAYTLDDVTTTSTSSVSSTFQAYYVTYGTGWEANGTKFNLTGASVTTDTYANSYSSLVGKYLPQCSISNSGSTTAGIKKTTIGLSSICYVVSATSSNFTYKIIGSNKKTTEALLASTEDEYGISYYFRGMVINNYVEFANKCWRIVRIGGDNIVKLILHNDNTKKLSNPCSSTNNGNVTAFILYDGTNYTSAFNSNYTDNAYVGFMYGTPGSSTYEATHANTNKSTILTNLETWYNNNLEGYESVIADNVFCNDKNISGSGLGYGTNSTGYMAYERLVTNKTPSLKCNGDLSKVTSKIGLITADELVYAGYAYKLYNTKTYLQENTDFMDWWWSLSPYAFDGYNAYVWGVNGIDRGLVGGMVVDGGGLRPYISIKSSTMVSSGSGTSEDPYVVDA